MSCEATSVEKATDATVVVPRTAAVTEGVVSARQLRFIIFGSTMGTLIDWYDFYIYGSLATILAAQFFPSANPLLSFLAAVGVFGVGFAVRPFGALLFGWMGDKLGRKVTFMITILGMGVSTFLIGLLPTAAQVGVFAGVLLAILRIIQGLSLGGEYGGPSSTFLSMRLTTRGDTTHLGSRPRQRSASSWPS